MAVAKSAALITLTKSRTAPIPGQDRQSGRRHPPVRYADVSPVRPPAMDGRNGWGWGRPAAQAIQSRTRKNRERKSVGEGKRVSVRVDIGGRRIHKKKRKKKK